MKFNFLSVFWDDDLELSLAGDVLTINGEALDLSVIRAGATLPASAVDCKFLTGNIERDLDGEISLTIILPCAYRAPYERRFAAPLVVTEDGPIGLPDNTPEDAPHAD